VYRDEILLSWKGKGREGGGERRRMGGRREGEGESGRREAGRGEKGRGREREVY
jgi:hypothetical protein